MSRVNRNRQPALSRRKKRSQRNQVDGADKKVEEEEIYECIVVRLPGEIGARGETRESVSTAKTTVEVAQVVDSTEHVTCPNDRLPMGASGVRNTRSRARAKIFAQEPEESEFTPTRGVRTRRSACGSRMHKATHKEMGGVSTSPEPVATHEEGGREANTPVTNPPARLSARDMPNHEPALTAETPKSVLRRSTRKIPVSRSPPPVEAKRRFAKPAKRVKEPVNRDRDEGVIMFRSEIDIDIPTEFEESNVRADLTGRPAFPVGRGGG